MPVPFSRLTFFSAIIHESGDEMNRRQLFLTPQGEAQLRKELEELTGQRRSELADRLRFAIQQGDLTENANYIAAKEEQAFLEGKILELETILRDAVIVEDTGPGDQVRIGSTVVITIDGGDPETFHLVGIKEADPPQRRISHESPIGKALLGKRVGESAIAETPGGKIKLDILDIR